ncbi:MAG: glucose 1-dehydrogenase [Rhodocyclaceae bacterium]|nr:glucose 1-dehydrogenase [Rhodocyclaceae bacterium]MCA3073619.1 glucose 1-dehydrogenase [Rhodocyclaceae bacterium]MCA3089024.1 glucose 1-dehydrogenase [Rhodocyclaceae bacterium]MCA3095760.1 glucose 1-dehydrogenase [Rhodocyclaceae bacterium]MCA3097767.1 glucose 1-dehydrogenase [Rhodocyclaceae bacterium]
MRLKNKVSIITGSARGIGQSTALKFAREGGKVVVCDLTPELIQETVATIRSGGGEAIGCLVDVRDMQSIRRMVDEVLSTFGRIDVLVNNAGIVKDAQLKNMTDEQFDLVIDINLKGVYNCTRAVVDTMLQQQSGVILSSSSIVGLYGNFGQTNYAATKGAVISMTKTWAKELGRKGIRANAVCPGFIGTTILNSMPERVLRAMEEKVPLGRLGKPEEIADAFAFLASDEASYINGIVLEVGGGVTL